MSRWFALTVAVVFVVVVALARSASAQAPGGGISDPPISVVLEQRVPEELAAEGVVLSGRSLVLQVEQVGAKLLVSLVDQTTGRVAASTTIGRVPADRDAAVAAVTHVVAELASEVAARTAPPPPVDANEPRADRDLRDAAELRFRRGAIGFGADVSVYVYSSPKRFVAGASRRWYPYQGELKTRLEPTEFFKLVGRSDLEQAYRRRRTMMLGLYWGGTALAAGSAMLGLASLDDGHGSIGRLQHAALAGLCVGLTAVAAGRWLQRSPQPISENEAKAMADQYNTRLRRELGLPVATRARPGRDVHVLPYVGARDAGVALATSF